MNQLRKVAFKPNSESASTHTQTQRFSETANLSESRDEIFNKARINAALPPSIGPVSIA